MSLRSMPEPAGADVGKKWGEWVFVVHENCFVAHSLLEPLQISLLAPAGGDVQLEELLHARRQGSLGRQPSEPFPP